MSRGPKHHDRGWRDWYQLGRWRALAKAQLRAQPLCAMCFAKGKITRATIADHIEHHDADWDRFILGRLQSLCEACHNEKHVVARCGPRIRYGEDGWPLQDDQPVTNRSAGL